MQNKSSKYDHY